MLLKTLRKHLFENLYCLRNRSPKMRYWKELERTQYLPERALRKRQWQRLIWLITYAYQNNRFYRRRFDEADVNPGDINTSEDMKRIPILTKEEIRSHTQEIISNGYNINNLLKFKTGGSTGKPLEICITEECSELRNACARRHDRWTGWELGEPIGAVWGNPRLPVNIKSRLKHWLLTPFIYFDTMSVTEESVKQFAIEWKKMKPTLLFGHAHSLFILAEYVRNLGINSIKPKAIISTSMMLLPHEKRTIEDVFGLKVFDRYGCEEVSLIASECEMHKGMHLNIEHLFIEFIKDDGSYSEPGEPGRIIVTDLMNKAMPFIRYNVEDIGVPSKNKCPCGRGLPLMEKVVGRTADFLIKKDGTKVAGVSLIENTLTRIPGLDQMQIIQDSLDLVTLILVVNSDFEASNEKELVSYFEHLFLHNTKIVVRYVKKIKPESSGKYRFTICNIR